MTRSDQRSRLPFSLIEQSVAQPHGASRVLDGHDQAGYKKYTQYKNSCTMTNIAQLLIPRSLMLLGCNTQATMISATSE